MTRTRLRPAAALVAAVMLLAAVPRVAWAEDPPDLVRTKAGGVLRGRIVELVTGDHVTLLGSDGQERKLPMSEIVYAGPAASEPGATRSPETEPTGPHLSLRADEPGLTYFEELGTTSLVAPSNLSPTAAIVRPLCTAPCTTTLTPGPHTFRIQRASGESAVAPMLTLRGDEVLDARYISRSRVRWGLLLGGVGLMAIGAGVGFASKNVCEGDAAAPTCRSTYPHADAGAVMFGLGLILVFVPLLLISDSASVTPTRR